MVMKKNMRFVALHSYVSSCIMKPDENRFTRDGIFFRVCVCVCVCVFTFGITIVGFEVSVDENAPPQNSILITILMLCRERVYGNPRRYWSDGPFNSSPNAIGEKATMDWISLADIYTFPHIQVSKRPNFSLSLLRFTVD